MIYQDIYPQLRNPQRDTSTWSFSIGGSVRHPFIIAYSDLLLMPMVEVTCAILCAGNPHDDSAIEQATWRGVALSSLLENVITQPAARYAIIHNASGYSTSLSLDGLSRGILALQQDGKSLSHKQGFPARLVMPGSYGYKSPRWVERIELSSLPQGFWEARGWDGDGVAPTIAAITHPFNHAHVRGAVELKGFAYSADQRITSVEVSVDYADWMPVDFTTSLSTELIRWQAIWTLPNPGEYSVRVRAVGDGEYVVTSAPPSHLKSGQVPLHSIVIHVTE